MKEALACEREIFMVELAKRDKTIADLNQIIVSLRSDKEAHDRYMASSASYAMHARKATLQH